MKSDLTYSKLLYDYCTDYDDSDQSYSFVLQGKDNSIGYQILLSYSLSKISILAMNLNGQQYQVNHAIPPLSINLMSKEMYDEIAIKNAIVELLGGMRVSRFDLNGYISSNLEKFVIELLNDVKTRKALSDNAVLPTPPAKDDIRKSKRMEFWEAGNTVYFTKYFCFKGRASRSEFWWATLYGILLSFIIMFFAGFIVGFAHGNDDIIAVIAFLVMLAFVFPTCGLIVRRLHDANSSGWWLLLYLLLSVIPFLALLPYIVIGCRSPVDCNNRYN